MDKIDAGVIKSVKIGNGSETVAMKETIAISKKTAGDGLELKRRNKKKSTVMLTSEGSVKGCTLQVSNNKKPLVFYLNLAKKYLNQKKYVELSALGMAIPTAVTIAEILKNYGWATEKDVTISSVPLMDDVKGREIRKAKIEILLEKTTKFVKNELVAAKGPSEVGANETMEFSSETNKKEIERKYQFGTCESSTEDNGSKNVSIELIEGNLTVENYPKNVSIELTEENDPENVSIEPIKGSTTEEKDPKNVSMVLIDGKEMSTDHNIE